MADNQGNIVGSGAIHDPTPEGYSRRVPRALPPIDPGEVKAIEEAFHSAAASFTRSPPPRPRPAKRLEELAKLFEEKNRQYGDAYKTVGALMVALYPEGKTLTTVQDWCEFSALMNILGNLRRFAAGHGRSEENLGDTAVYAMLLEDIILEDIILGDK